MKDAPQGHWPELFENVKVKRSYRETKGAFGSQEACGYNGSMKLGLGAGGGPGGGQRPVHPGLGSSAS